MFFRVQTGGCTALGPAMLIAVSMACKVPGSKVIMCTDGCANSGVGALSGYSSSDTSQQEANEFYTEVADMARQKGYAHCSVIPVRFDLGSTFHKTRGLQMNLTIEIAFMQISALVA